MREDLLLDIVLPASEAILAVATSDEAAAVRERLLKDGAAEVLLAVFCEKDLGRPKPIRADFVGAMLPDKYLFGFGMDVNEAWRNLPAVYALKE